VVACSIYISGQISGLRELQNNLVDRNRKDSLQLLRIRTTSTRWRWPCVTCWDNNGPYPLTAWSAQFQRVRDDLNDALRQEAAGCVADRTPEQRDYLKNSMAQFWDAVDRTFCPGRQRQAGRSAQPDPAFLAGGQAALSTAVARLLVQNNESEEQAACCA